ncbi:MAG: hypothetical protein ACLT5P_17850, partial [Flavonifractor plautii]
VQVLRKLQNCGLEASGLATGRVYTVDGLGLGMADADRRRAAVDRMLAFLPVCAELGGAKLIIGAIRGWTRDAGGRDVYGSLFRASLEEILNQAEPLGVPVALDAISRMDSDAYCPLQKQRTLSAPSIAPPSGFSWIPSPPMGRHSCERSFGREN